MQFKFHRDNTPSACRRRDHPVSPVRRLSSPALSDPRRSLVEMSLRRSFLCIRKCRLVSSLAARRSENNGSRVLFLLGDVNTTEYHSKSVF